MKYLSVILLTLLCSNSSAQIFSYWMTLDYKKYYPLNYYGTITDTFSTQNLSVMLLDIDTSTSSIYRKLASQEFRKIYKDDGDTIKSFKYDFKKREFTGFEVFAYNKKKQIEYYIDCTDYSFDKNNITVQVIQFFYNDKNEMTDKLVYYKRGYRLPIN